jgi:hypothetical protein
MIGLLGMLSNSVAPYAWPTLTLLLAAELAPGGDVGLTQGGIVIAVVAILGKVIYDIVRDLRVSKDPRCSSGQALHQLSNDLRDAAGVGHQAMAEVWRELHTLGQRIARLEGRGERNGMKENG